jgi:hypothetical protein
LGLVGFTLCATRFDTPDLVYRLLTLLAMFAVAGLASPVPHTRDGLLRRHGEPAVVAATSPTGSAEIWTTFWRRSRRDV